MTLAPRLRREGREPSEPRTRHTGGSFLVVILASVTYFGCNALIGLELGEPEEVISNPPGSGGGAASGGSVTGGTGGAGGAGGDGGTGGSPPNCVPSGNDSPVEDICGVFVSSSLGDDSGDGTKERPFKTLSMALSAAQGRPVYACSEEFSEAVAVGSVTTLYGGLNCEDAWQYVGNTIKTSLTAPSGAIPLTVQSETTIAHMEDFSVSAASAVEPGSSSIAVLVDRATATFHRCDLTAGDGADGLDGAEPPNAEDTAPSGDSGNQACTGYPGSSSVSGGDPTTNPLCPTSVGGLGGSGLIAAFGNDGSSGAPGGAVNSGTGQIEDGPNCTDGGSGTDGGDGEDGVGATALGTLSSEGYTGADGANGTDGGVAQGGGGGGGKRNRDCDPNTGGSQLGPGASGGSGGPGGCGGLGGHGGKAGGASIALVSIQADVSLEDVSLTAAKGGKGGDGAQGQTGQLGGIGGNRGPGLWVSEAQPNVAPACPGGTGGKGGDGGQGGGGRGGHSIGIAYTGGEPTRDEVTITLPALAASGGTGGTPGAEGLLVGLQSF